MFKFIQTQNPQ